MQSTAMDFLKTSRHNPTRNPNQDADVEEGCHKPITLQTMPIELLLCILDFLDIKDKTCLSFCNRFLRGIVNTPAWRQRHSDMLSDFDERQDFLLRLVRDHPDHLVCEVCSTIHHMTRLTPLAAVMHKHSKCYPRFPQPCTKLLALDRIDLRSSVYELNRSHVRLAMERHRYGSRYGIPLNLLSIREVEEDWISNPRWTRMLSVEPIITADALHLRIQDLWLFLSPTEADETILERVRLQFCRHHLGIAADVLLCKLRHSNRLNNCPTCCQHQRCNICGVEFQADIRTLACGRKAVIVTRLLDLGDGGDESNQKWDLLISKYWPIDTLRGRAVEEVIERGSNEAWRFVEDRGLRPLGEVTDSNMSTLCSESYKVYFNRLIWEGWRSRPYQDNRHWVHQAGTDVDRFWPGSPLSLYDKTGRPKQSIRHSTHDPLVDTSRAKPVSESQPHSATQSLICSDHSEVQKNQLYMSSARPLVKPELQPKSEHPAVPASYHFEYHPGVAADRIEPEHESKSQKPKEGVWRSLKNFFSRK